MNTASSGRRDPDDRSDAEATELDELRGLAADRLGHLFANVVEVDAEPAQGPPLVARQRDRLQVRQDRRDLVVGAVGDQGADRLGPAGQHDRGNEHLGVVGAELFGARCHAGAPEVDESEGLVDDDQMLLVDRAVGDPGAVERVDELPQLAQRRPRLWAAEPAIGWCVRADHTVGFDEQRPGPAQDEQGVVGLGGAGDHHGVGGDPCLPGEQREQRLVLHLSQAAESDGRSGAAEPDRALDRREHRRVVGVTSVDLDDQLAAVGCGGGHRELAGRLAVGDADRRRRHARGRRARSARRRGSAARRSNRPPGATAAAAAAAISTPATTPVTLLNRWRSSPAIRRRAASAPPGGRVGPGAVMP